MQVMSLMTKNPACCVPETTLQQAALMMRELHCGALPVVNNLETRVPVGIITDRDITCRILAQGKNPLQKHVRDCMTSPVVTVSPETSLEECCRLMEENQIRRIPVVNHKGACSGIVTQADIAALAPPEETCEVVKAISQPSLAASHRTLIDA